METVKMKTEKNYIVKKEVVAVKDTLLQLPKGESVKFDCRDFAPYGSVQAAISRLNKETGKVAFTSTTSDNGATYEVTRNS